MFGKTVETLEARAGSLITPSVVRPEMNDIQNVEDRVFLFCDKATQFLSLLIFFLLVARGPFLG
jgi:hypothetical protein